MIRVLHIINSLSVPRGAERICVETVNASETHFVVDWRRASSPAFNVGEEKYKRLTGVLHLIYFLVKKRRQFDLYHLHLFPTFYLAFILGARSIVHEHGNGVNNRRHGSKFFKLLESLVFRRAGAVVCVNETARQRLIDYQAALKKKTYLLENFVAPQVVAEGKRLAFCRELPTPRKKIFGMAAAFDSNKAQDIVVRALAFLPREYTILFAGVGERLIKVQKLSVDLGVDDRCVFLGHVPDVTKVFSQCEAMLLISRQESFGLVVLEAAAFGLRTICSDIPCLRDICAFSDDLAANSPRDVADRMLNFDTRSGDQEILESLVQKYSLERYLGSLNEIYNQLMRTS